MQAGHTISSHAGIICAKLKHTSPQLDDNLLVTVTNTHKIKILLDFHLQTTLFITFIVYNCFYLFVSSSSFNLNHLFKLFTRPTNYKLCYKTLPKVNKS